MARRDIDRLVYYKLLLTQTEEGITEFRAGPKKYRISVITYRLRDRTKTRFEYKYVIADSFANALDLTAYIS